MISPRHPRTPGAGKRWHRRRERPRVIGAKSSLTAHDTDRPNGASAACAPAERLPDSRDRRAVGHVTLALGLAGHLAQSREELHLHTHARLLASRRAASSSGAAVAPSTQASPSVKNSCFQIGRDLLHALDRVPARPRRPPRDAPPRRRRPRSPGRRRGVRCDGESPRARAGHSASNLVDDPLEGLQRQRLERLVLEVADPAPGMRARARRRRTCTSRRTPRRRA